MTNESPPTWQPACMSEDEHDEWKAAAEWARRTADVYVPRVCQDCTFAFRQENLLAGTCNGRIRRGGRPRTEGEQYDVHRLAQWRAYNARKKAGIRIRRTVDETNLLAERVRAMLDAGSSVREVGASLGLAGHYVRKLASRPQHRPHTPPELRQQWREAAARFRAGVRLIRSRSEAEELVARAAKLRESGKSWAEVGVLLNAKPKSLSRALSRARQRAAA